MSLKYDTSSSAQNRGWNKLKKQIYCLRSAMSSNEQTIALLEQEIKTQKYEQNLLKTEKDKMKQLLLDIANNQSKLAKSIESELLKLEENRKKFSTNDVDLTAIPRSNVVMKASNFIPFKESIDIMRGTYIRTYVDNYGGYLKKMGVKGFVRRNAIQSSIEANGITKTIETCEGVWKFITKTGKKSSQIEFRIGIPFFQIVAGNKYRSTITLDRSLMISEFKAVSNGKKSFLVIRSFSSSGFESKVICEDVVCVEYFKRQ